MTSSPVVAWLRWLRVPLAPTAAWDALACWLLALGWAGTPLREVPAGDAALLALTSLLLYFFGMGLNDLADRRCDARIAPDRPLPSGRIAPALATVVVVLLAAGAIALGGGPAGRREAVVGAVVAAALYDLFAKRALLPGAAAMGLVRFLNASVAVWPLVLAGVVPAWLLAGPAAVGLYSAGVTVWSTTEEGNVLDAPARRVAARVLLAAAALAAGLLPWLVTGAPTLGIFVGATMATSVAFARRPRPGPAKRQVLEMLLGLYYVSMCLATGADGGSLLATGLAFTTAVVLLYATQRAIRALARAA